MNSASAEMIFATAVISNAILIMVMVFFSFLSAIIGVA